MYCAIQELIQKRIKPRDPRRCQAPWHLKSCGGETIINEVERDIMGRSDVLIPLEVAMYPYRIQSNEGDSNDNEQCMKDHGDFMRNLQMIKEKVDNVQTDFQSSLRSIATDDLGTIFETDDHEDSDVNGDVKSTNSPAASAKNYNDKFLQTMPNVNNKGEKTKLTPSISPYAEINDQLGPSVESRRLSYGRRLSTCDSTLSSDEMDSSQSGSSRSSSHSLFSKQSFAKARLATGIRSNCSGDLSKDKHPSKLSSNRRQNFRRSSSLPGKFTTNSIWDHTDPFKSMVESSRMIELLRKKGQKNKSAYNASRMIQEINEGEAIVGAMAQQKVADEYATNKEQEIQKNLKSNRIFGPIITIVEPDGDDYLSIASDDLSVSLGRSIELDFSQSSLF